jgi:hypothetical protein
VAEGGCATSRGSTFIARTLNQRFDLSQAQSPVLAERRSRAVPRVIRHTPRDLSSRSVGLWGRLRAGWGWGVSSRQEPEEANSEPRERGARSCHGARSGGGRELTPARDSGRAAGSVCDRAHPKSQKFLGLRRGHTQEPAAGYQRAKKHETTTRDRPFCRAEHRLRRPGRVPQAARDVVVVVEVAPGALELGRPSSREEGKRGQDETGRETKPMNAPSSQSYPPMDRGVLVI